MPYSLGELIDLGRLQAQMERFHTATGIPFALFGANGELLARAGWQEICLKFHRAIPLSGDLCRAYDANIASLSILDNSPALQHCPNGLMRAGLPLIIDGRRMGTLTLSQFLTTPPDRERFRRQAVKLGVDPAAYLAALDKVPVLSPERVQHLLEYYRGLADYLARLGQRRLSRRLRESELRGALEAAKRAKEEFLANMSHELRTPLNGIMGMLQLVRTTSLSEAQCEYVDTALEASRHLLSLLNDVLDYAAVESGRLPLQCVEFSPEALLSSMAAIYREQCRAKGLDFRFLYDPAIPPKILGDPGRVRQIIFNLVGNAIKFTHRGCVTLDASLLHCDTPGRCRLLFSIGDTGIGIPEEKIAHVFDDFTQVDGSISRHYQGTGLGLALVKRLVQLLGGTIALDSEPGAGTTFMFCVQLGLPKPVPAGRPERQSATPRVLVAEDNPSTQFALRDLLDSLGCESVMVPNGREALMALSEEPFACVLMDVQMPEMDGLEATRFIRAAAVERIDPEVPIIGLLAPSVGTGCDSFIKAGMNDCLVKPLERNVLAEALAPFLIR